MASDRADGWAAAPTRAQVVAAAARIAGYVRRTPVARVELAGRDVWLKLEQLQVTGSFKARGATNALRCLHPLPRAVVAASGGNHGIGVAHAAAAVDVQATVVVPETAPDAKAASMAARGATVVRHGASYAAAEAYGRELAEDLGAPFLHPYADADVVAGQGTVGLELAEQVGAQAAAVLVPVGGGGLLAGIALALEGGPLRVIGVEPTGAPTMHDALAAGVPVDVEVDTVTASALGAARAAPLTLAVARRAVEGVVLVEDRDALAARDLLWRECRLAVEPAAAAGLAALLDGAVDVEPACLLLSGANTGWTPVGP